jgi:hypothetical protein
VEEGSNPFFKAYDYLTLFLHLNSLETGNTFAVYEGIGIHIDSMEDLGKNRVGFPSFQPINQLNAPFPDHVLYIEKQMKQYQELEQEATEIIHSEIGLALQFYHDGLQSHSIGRPDLAIVHFMIAAEALVIIGEEGKRKNVSNRLAALYYPMDKFEEGSRTLKKLYDLRSSVVHGGRNKPSLSEIKTIYLAVRRVLKDRIQHRHLDKELYVGRIEKLLRVVRENEST